MTSLTQLFGAAYSKRHMVIKPARRGGSVTEKSVRSWAALEALEPRMMLSAPTSFDFGTATSPVAAGYTQVTNTTTFSATTGFGWQSGTILSADRATSNALTRDFNYTKNGTFGVNLANGNYTVALTLGDTGISAHDQMGVFLEGAKVDSVTTGSGQVVTKTYSVTVADGQLNLQLQDLGGTDLNAVIEAMQIAPAAAGTTVTTAPPRSTAAFDFGTATSPVAAGYTQVTNSTTFSATTGFGWQSGTISAADRSTADPLTRDFNYTTNGTFGVNVVNGAYQITVTVGDTGASAHDLVGIFIEGAQVDSVTTAAGQVVTKTYNVSVTDGQLNLQLKDLGGKDANAVIEGLQLVPASAAPTTTGAPPTTSGGAVTTGGGTTTIIPPPATPVTLGVLNNGPPQGTLPFGAGANDTSEYMLGSVEVNVVLLQSNGAIDPSNEPWNPTMITNVESQVTQELVWWRDLFYKTQNPAPGEYLNFYTDFTYANNPVSTPYEPINHRSTDQGLWINSFLNQVGDGSTGSYMNGVRAFDNQQRAKYGTDWSFTIFVVNSINDADGSFADGASAYTYVNGPFTMETYTNGGWGINRMSLVLAHETAIDFGALDEYAGTQSYTAKSGYYDTQNLNAADGNPNPAGRVTSLMADGGSLTTAYNTYTSSPTSLQMIGWKDSDGNGIMDVLDVPLSLAGTAVFNTSTMTLTLTGTSSAGTLANHNPYTADHAITLNTVDQLQYSLDGGAWAAAANYGTATASINQGVTVAAGAHTISFRTVDTSLGIASNVLTGSFNTALGGAVALTASATAPATTTTTTSTTTSVNAPAAPMTKKVFPSNKAAQLVAATWSKANVMPTWLKLSPVQDGGNNDNGTN